MNAAPGQKRGGGCFAGCCLTGCLLVVAVPLVALVLLLFFGRNWMIDKAQERIPALSLIKDAAVTLDGDRSGSTERGDFPSHVHVPTGAISQAYRVQDGGALGVLQLERPAAALTREMKDRMQKRGWRIARTAGLHDGTRLTFEKGSERCIVQVFGSGTESEVWIELQKS